MSNNQQPPEGQPIPQEYITWFLAESRKGPSSRAYEEWKRRGQQLCYEVAYGEGYENASEAAYRKLTETKAAPVLPPSSVGEAALRDIISRADWYLRGIEEDNDHDPSVGMYRDEKLTQLVKDIQALSPPNPSRAGEISPVSLRWVKASERMPSHGRLIYCRTTKGRKIVTSRVKGEWDDIDLNDDETVLEWLEEAPPNRAPEVKPFDLENTVSLNATASAMFAAKDNPVEQYFRCKEPWPRCRTQCDECFYAPIEQPAHVPDIHVGDIPEEIDESWESRKIDRLCDVITMSEDHIRELQEELRQATIIHEKTGNVLQATIATLTQQRGEYGRVLVEIFDGLDHESKQIVAPILDKYKTTIE